MKAIFQGSWKYNTVAFLSSTTAPPPHIISLEALWSLPCCQALVRIPDISLEYLIAYIVRSDRNITYILYANICFTWNKLSGGAWNTSVDLQRSLVLAKLTIPIRIEIAWPYGEQWFGKHMRGSYCSPIYGTIVAFIWKDGRKTRQTLL
jgi:hypothetical protein